MKYDIELQEALEHYRTGVEDMDQRRLRDGGWNDVIKAYHGILPKDWPYLAQVTDPVIRTTILEKTARLFNGKLRGRLVPREGGDNIKATIQNALLEYQWDRADEGGSMLEKWAFMDLQTRLYGASFAYVYWGKNDCNEFKVCDPRDVLIDYSATHIKNANWVQYREFKLITDLEEANEQAKEQDLPIIYGGLSKLVEKMAKYGKKTVGDNREQNYESEMKIIRGLEDRVGKDRAFPVIEVVTEFRKDRWIVFAPTYNHLFATIPNPFDHKEIPIVQLRYYPVPDDIYGESEVESVMPIAHGINALLCGAIDEANLTMAPPIKVANADGSVRMDTIVYGPNAVWQTGSSNNNVMEHQTSGVFTNNFQTMYTALKSAFNTAMGDMSMGVSSLDSFSNDKTATEVKQMERQKLSRDQYNQIYLEQALKDTMMFWVSNNKQFLFNDPDKFVHVLRVVGKDMIKDLQAMALDDMTNDPEALKMLQQAITQNPEMSDIELNELSKLTMVPRYPVIDKGKDIKPKLSIDEDGENGELYMTKEDFDGIYDFIPDVESMAMGVAKERERGRDTALQMVLNPAIQQGLMQEGFTLQMKDIVVSVLQDRGFKDAEKFFKPINEQGLGQPIGQQSPAGGGVAPTANTVAQPQGLPANAPVPSAGGEVPVPTPQ